MAILTLAIYGSRSRGDYTNSSDIDLFAITDEEYYKMVVDGKTNLACYPMGLAEQRAINGDLFILHICSEAKEIYGDGFYLMQLRNSFKYKKNYNHVKINAADLAWFLIDLSPKIRNTLLLNKRIAWCVRTILIASAAESRKSIFSKKGLVDYSGHQFVDNLISSKDLPVYNRTLIHNLEDFLISLGFYRPILSTISMDSYRELFFIKGNEMGLKTLMSLATDDTSLEYS